MGARSYEMSGTLFSQEKFGDSYNNLIIQKSIE